MLEKPLESFAESGEFGSKENNDTEKQVHEHEDDIEQVREALRGLGKHVDADVRKEAIEEVYSMLLDRGYRMAPHQKFWNKAKDRGLLLRREDPEKVFQMLLEKNDIELEPSYYEDNANTATDTDEGLRYANEGLSGREVSVTYAFRPDGFEVKNVPIPENDPRDSKRYHYVRSASGTLHPDNVEYVIVRTKTEWFPEEFLTDEERDAMEDDEPPRYIFRAVFPDSSDSEAKKGDASSGRGVSG